MSDGKEAMTSEERLMAAIQVKPENLRALIETGKTYQPSRC